MKTRFKCHLGAGRGIVALALANAAAQSVPMPEQALIGWQLVCLPRSARGGAMNAAARMLALALASLLLLGIFGALRARAQTRPERSEVGATGTTSGRTSVPTPLAAMHSTMAARSSSRPAPPDSTRSS